MEAGGASFYAVAAVAVFVAAVSKGGFGSGAAFAGAVILALVVPPDRALAIMLPLLMLMDATALPAFWRRWDGPAARALILGAVPGVALAALVVSRAPADAIRVLIGAIALGFVAFQVARSRGLVRPEGLPAGRVSGGIWGAVAGFTSFVSHAGGPPAAVYLLSRGVAKEAYQATTVVTFWAINLMKIGPYVALGAVDTDTLWTAAALAPVAVAGIGAGIVAHRVISPVWYFRVTYTLLVVAGARLVWTGVT